MWSEHALDSFNPDPRGAGEVVVAGIALLLSKLAPGYWGRAPVLARQRAHRAPGIRRKRALAVLYGLRQNRGARVQVFHLSDRPAIARVCSLHNSAAAGIGAGSNLRLPVLIVIPGPLGFVTFASVAAQLRLRLCEFPLSRSACSGWLTGEI
jgi:hypothetical protein